MSQFTDYLNNDFLEAYGELFPEDNPTPIYVYVESDEDVAFWKYVLSPYERNSNYKFHIKLPSQTGLQKGKTQVLSHTEGITDLVSGELGEYLILCVDSDYDYLLNGHYQSPEKQIVATKINDNPFIFQTYSYSIENLKCFAEELNQICVSTTLVDDKRIDFEIFLHGYSKIVYPLLLANLHFHANEHETEFTLDDFRVCVEISTPINFENHAITHLQTIQEKVARKLNSLREIEPNLDDLINDLAADLEKKGLMKYNTYLFMQGHALFDNVVLMLLKPFVRSTKTMHLRSIDAQATNDNDNQDAITNTKNQYLNNIGRDNIADHLVKNLSTNYRFQNCFLFQKIQADIQNYWSNFQPTA